MNLQWLWSTCCWEEAAWQRVPNKDFIFISLNYIRRSQSEFGKLIVAHVITCQQCEKTLLNFMHLPKLCIQLIACCLYYSGMASFWSALARICMLANWLGGVLSGLSLQSVMKYGPYLITWRGPSLWVYYYYYLKVWWTLFHSQKNKNLIWTWLLSCFSRYVPLYCRTDIHLVAVHGRTKEHAINLLATPAVESNA